MESPPDSNSAMEASPVDREDHGIMDSEAESLHQEILEDDVTEDNGIIDSEAEPPNQEILQDNAMEEHGIIASEAESPDEKIQHDDRIGRRFSFSLGVLFTWIRSFTWNPFSWIPSSFTWNPLTWSRHRAARGSYRVTAPPVVADGIIASEAEPPRHVRHSGRGRSYQLIAPPFDEEILEDNVMEDHEIIHSGAESPDEEILQNTPKCDMILLETEDFNSWNCWKVDLDIDEACGTVDNDEAWAEAGRGRSYKLIPPPVVTDRGFTPVDEEEPLQP